MMKPAVHRTCGASMSFSLSEPLAPNEFKLAKKGITGSGALSLAQAIRRQQPTFNCSFSQVER